VAFKSKDTHKASLTLCEMENEPPYKIFFINECAATIDFGNIISEEINGRVITLFNRLCKDPPEGMIEAIPAYSSLTVYFNVCFLRKKISSQVRVNDWIMAELHRQMQLDLTGSTEQKDTVRIPVCYEDEFAIDLLWMSKQKNIPVEEIIRLHFSKQYRVYMLGFLPGFPYMAEVDEKIAIPRKPQPQTIPFGSIGIAGKQTGVYPLTSPGGWQIIGRTPIKIFDKNKTSLCLLKAGDYVEFYPITKNEFENY
jgi:inhibitor of KinA